MILWSVGCAHTAPAQEFGCASVSHCIQLAREVAEPATGHEPEISKRERVVVERLTSLGDMAVPPLVALLADPDENVAQIGAAALRDVERIDPVFLPQIIAGLDRGLPWLPPALARIDDPRAAEEAVRRLLASGSYENQEGYAVRLCGGRAVPFIAEAARCREGCPAGYEWLLGRALSDIGADASGAGPPLVDIVVDDATAPEVARGALFIVSNLGAAGHELEGALLGLRDGRLDLVDAIDEALIGIRSDFAGEIFARRLHEAPDELALMDLARVGVAGRDAGPEVVKLLDHPDWGIRLQAVRALGSIGYELAEPLLIALLDDPRDVRVNCAAADSLGELGASSTVPALQRVAVSHWYPQAREAAGRALGRIRAGETGSEPEASGLRAVTIPPLDPWQRLDPGYCETVALKSVAEPPSQKLYASTSEGRIESLAYRTEVIGIGADNEEEQRAEGRSVIEVTPENAVIHRTPIDQVPDVALRVDGGWLVGSSRGEWGGELVFLGDDGVSETVLRANIEDVYRFGDRYVTVTGLAHLGSNDGMVYEITQSRSGSWDAQPWRALPGAPHSSWLVEGEGLVIHALGAGTILVSRAGDLRIAPCAEGSS